jgi:ribosome-associated protein
MLRLPRIAPIVDCRPRDSNYLRGEELLRSFCVVSNLLEIRPGVAVPMDEIELRTSRSSGPGGQHANVTASRVEAVFDVHASEALSTGQKARVAARLGPRVTASAQDTRSQLRNRELALERLAQRLAHALEVRRPRTATRPTAASKRRRVEAKKRRGEVKRARRPPAGDG